LVGYQVAETCLTSFSELQKPLPVHQRIGKTFQRQELSQSILCPTPATISERITQSTNEVLNVLIRPVCRLRRLVRLRLAMMEKSDLCSFITPRQTNCHH
jgi:hypothetical protein